VNHPLLSKTQFRSIKRISQLKFRLSQSAIEPATSNLQSKKWHGHYSTTSNPSVRHADWRCLPQKTRVRRFNHLNRALNLPAVISMEAVDLSNLRYPLSNKACNNTRYVRVMSIYTAESESAGALDWNDSASVSLDDCFLWECYLGPQFTISPQT
jgi:hypothetical protein